jgi:hypothetical protein
MRFAKLLFAGWAAACGAVSANAASSKAGTDRYAKHLFI